MDLSLDLEAMKSSFERLHGILADTSTDGRISRTEAEDLKGWLSRHKYRGGVEPFESLSQLLYRYSENRFIDEDERTELMAWCRDYIDRFPNPFQPCLTAIERIEGIIQETHMDGSVTDFVIIELQGWLQEYEGMTSHWPFVEVRQLVEKVLMQGGITENDMGALLELCKQMNRQVRSGSPRDALLSDALLYFRPIDHFYPKVTQITFQGRRFCFTGDTKSGPRRRLMAMARDLLGIVDHGVTPGLDYLVVGGINRNYWPYGIYWKRIGAAIVNIQNGDPTVIIPEREFISQTVAMTHRQ